jgi:hypothetical protein
MFNHAFTVAVLASFISVGGFGCASTGEPPDEDRPAPQYRSVDNTPDDEPEASEETTSQSAKQPSASVRSEARDYQSTVVDALHDRWSPPAMDAEQLDSLGAKVVVYVRLDEAGKIVSYEFRRKSGSTPFDESIRECLEAFSGEEGARLPMPEDPRLQKALVRHGMNLRNWLVD